MIGILFISLSAVAIFILAGYPLIRLLFLDKPNQHKIEFATLISFSLILGFGLSALAVSLSYSLFGIGYYFIIYTVLIILNWLIFLRFSESKFKINLPKNNYQYFFILFTLISIYFAKSQWNKTFQPIIFSGGGPDVAQNLLAGMYADELGSTWSSSKNTFISQLGSDNFRQATLDMFRLPAQTDIAVVDYLVLGGRWALTVPMNQIISVFGPQTVFLEIGSVLVITLMSSLIIMFGLGKLLNLKNSWSLILAVAITFNGAFLNQYFNGGLSQAFGLIGNLGILTILIVILSNSPLIENKSQRLGIFLVSSAALLSSALAYIDATFTIVILIIALLFFYALFNRSIFTMMANLIVLPGVLAMVLSQVLIYNLLLGFQDRATAVSNTGVNVNNWKMPSQLMGILSSYSVYSEKTSIINQILSLIISLAIIIFVALHLRKRESSNFNFAVLGTFTILGYLFAFYIGFTLPNKSDYLYSKIGVYLAPFFLTSMILILIKYLSLNKSKSIALSLILILSSVNLVSAIVVENKFSSSTEIIIRIPNEYINLIKDEKSRKHLESNNYIMPYKVAYNYLGLFGAKYLISKAPNDMDYSKRVNNPLRGLCFQGDPACSIKTTQINNSGLGKYGILEYESTLSTTEYVSLQIIDRYNYVTDFIGQPRIIIPEKFLGGNPYLK
jgi:hypothetical protein